jgi:hypothetical protein
MGMNSSSAMKHLNKSEYVLSKNLPSTLTAKKISIDPPIRQVLLTEKRNPAGNTSLK